MNAALPTDLRRRTLSVREARSLGVSPKRLRGPGVARPFHGAVTTTPPQTLDERCRAFLAVAPPGAFFSGPTAAALHGLPLPRLPSGLHVSVPAPARAPRRAGVHGHSVRVAFGDVVVQDGLQLSAPSRAWCELAGTLALEDLVVAGDALLRNSGERDPRRSLRAALDRSVARRGRPDLVKAFGLLDPRAATPEESRLRFRLADAGIIGYETAFPIRTGSGRAHPGGLVFPERRVILECRHRRAQTDRDARDMTERRLDLQAHGWTIVELGPHDLADPGMPRRVRAILARATR